MRQSGAASFIYVLSRAVSSIDKVDDVRVNEVKCFTLIIIRISI